MIKEKIRKKSKGMVNMKATVEIVAGCGAIQGKKVTIQKGRKAKPGELTFNIPLKLFETYEVENIDWEEKGQRSAGKAAVGGVAGGLLAGPIGLIAGAAVGGRRKDTSTAVITVKNVGKLTVRATQKDLETINTLLYK